MTSVDSPSNETLLHHSRVLVVDHVRSHLGVMARRLGDAGYRVGCADSGGAAIAELHRRPVDLVLAELYMPGMDGIELTKLLRDDVAWRDLPIMLITGRSAPDGAVRAYAAGADDVILKPFHFEVLAARIERRIARVRAVEALRHDMQALDARIVTRAIELGELKDRLHSSERERLTLERHLHRKN